MCVEKEVKQGVGLFMFSKGVNIMSREQSIVPIDSERLTAKAEGEFQSGNGWKHVCCIYLEY